MNEEKTLTNIIGILAICLLSVSLEARAEPIHDCGIPCHLAMRATTIAGNYGSGTVFSIIDRSTGQAHSYRAYTIWMRGEPMERADPIATTANAAQKASALWQAKGVTQGDIYSIPADLPATPYADDLFGAEHFIAGGSLATQLIGDHITSQSLTLSDRITAIIDLYLTTFSLIPINFGLEITVVFPNGSMMRIEVVSGSAYPLHLQWKYVEGSAVNSEQTPIPDKPASFNGTRYFGEEQVFRDFEHVKDFFGLPTIRVCGSRISYDCSGPVGAQNCTLTLHCP